MAGGIAHEFNNILTIIIGFCHLIKMNSETAERHIPKIENAVERAAELCRQMMSYTGRATIDMTQVNMVALVNDMVSMLKSTTSQHAVINLD